MFSRQSLLKGVLLKKVLVTLKTGEGFSGLLHSFDRDVVVLVNVLLERDGDQKPIPADGALYIIRGDVAYMQVLSGVEV